MKVLGKTVQNSNNYWKIIKLKVQEQKIADAFALFRQNGIEPILIKGWATALYYPRLEERIFADLDFCVKPEQYDLAVDILKKNREGFQEIDLHKGFRHLDTLDWDDLFENSRLKKVNAEEFRILRPEDHLRVICVHWLNDGGASRERLWDIYYAVKNRPENFNWERCLNLVDEERRFWVVCAIAAANRYLKLEIGDTPIKSEVMKIPYWLTKTIEREWQSDIQLLPLTDCLPDKKRFFQQVFKRIPPNPIQATIECGGSFTENPRFYYQTLNLIQRGFKSGKKTFLKFEK